MNKLLLVVLTDRFGFCYKDIAVRIERGKNDNKIKNCQFDIYSFILLVVDIAYALSCYVHTVWIFNYILRVW
jgi:hypothetical protein